MSATVTTKAAIYLRQSLDRDQTKLAVERQRKDCLKLCTQHGWQPVEYCDNSVSATSGKTRPEYQRMLADIRDSKISAVVVWDLDRLHRQPRELEDFIDLADVHRLALATVTGDCDLSTDNGRLYARIKGAVGKSETERKSARQKRAAQQKAENGSPHWKRAFGYLSSADGPVLDPVTAPLVKQAYAALLAGSSLRDISRLFNAASAYGLTGAQWTISSVSLFLRQPRNAALRTYNDKIVGKGTWPPLVDEATWRAAQTVLNAPNRAPARKSVRKRLLTGILLCGQCGHHLTGEARRKTTDNSLVVIYACKQCRGVSIRAEHIEERMYNVVGGRLAMPNAVDLLKDKNHDDATAEKIRRELAALYARKQEIGAAVGDGLEISQAKAATDVVNAKISKLERQQQSQERLRVFDNIPLGEPQVIDAVKRLSQGRFRAVCDVMMTVTIAPTRGGCRFDPDRIKVKWRESFD